MDKDFNFPKYFSDELKYQKTRLDQLCAKFNKPLNELINEAHHYFKNYFERTEIDPNLKVDVSNRLHLGMVCSTYITYKTELKAMSLEDAVRGYVNLNANVVAIEVALLIEEQKTKALSDYGKMAHIGSDKQKEKLFIKECWLDWQKTPSKYASKREFADDMLDKCEHLKSQKKITDWCREWEVSSKV